MNFDALQHIQARHYRPTNGRSIDLFVVHTVEGDPDRPGEGDVAAENVARYLATRPEPVSAHLVIDDDSIVKCVRDQDVAYAAPGANHNGIQAELCGFARWTREQWLTDHMGTLCLTAQAMAHYHRRYNVPLVFVDAAGLKAGRRGITTHWQVTQAFRKSTHTDPGPGFPLADVIALALEFAKQP